MYFTECNDKLVFRNEKSLKALYFYCWAISALNHDPLSEQSARVSCILLKDIIAIHNAHAELFAVQYTFKSSNIN